MRAVMAAFFGLAFFVRLSAGLQADVQSCIFYQDGVPYVEVLFWIPTDSLSRTYDSDGRFHTRVDVLITLSADRKVFRADRFSLTSPGMKEPVPMLHVLRWPLRDGLQVLQTDISDAGIPERSISLVDSLVAAPVSSGMMLSDIQFFSVVKPASANPGPMAKNGFEFEPLPWNVMDRSLNVLQVYAETYGMKNLKTQDFVLRFRISHEDSAGVVRIDDEWYRHRKVSDPGAVLQSRDISTLVSDIYALEVAVMSKDRQVLCTRTEEFERVNPFWDRLISLRYDSPSDEEYFRAISPDSVHYYLRALNVILPSVDRDDLSKVDRSGNGNAGKMYLYRFWKDRFGDECVNRFARFRLNVLYADRQFVSGFRYGFESDRGLIYLKYGRPQEVIHEENDNGAYPYEIWFYDKMPTGQTNARFIFYNADKAGANFTLLHTNAYGERRNERWERELYRQVPDEYDGPNPVDAKKMKPAINRRAREYFEK